jgi:hypothetical protein
LLIEKMEAMSEDQQIPMHTQPINPSIVPADGKRTSANWIIARACLISKELVFLNILFS